MAGFRGFGHMDLIHLIDTRPQFIKITIFFNTDLR